MSRCASRVSVEVRRLSTCLAVCCHVCLLRYSDFQHVSSCLGGVYVRCIHRMPGGVIVGDSGLCSCGPALNVMCDVKCSSAITSHCLLMSRHVLSCLSVKVRLSTCFAVCHVCLLRYNDFQHVSSVLPCLSIEVQRL